MSEERKERGREERRQMRAGEDQGERARREAEGESDGQERRKAHAQKERERERERLPVTEREKERKRAGGCSLFADTGVGIDPAMATMLFQPFTQVDSSNSRRYGGSGLGLHISRKLAELMNGKIWYDEAHKRESLKMPETPLGT